MVILEISLELANYLSQVEYDSQLQLELSDEDKQDLNNDDTNLTYTLSISQASDLFIRTVLSKATVNWSSIAEDSIITYVQSTDLKSLHPGVYKLINSVILETYVFDYIEEKDASLLKYMNRRDIARVRRNIRYICDWLAQYRAYRFLVEYFRGLEVGLGYIENQIDIILKATDLRKSFGELTY